MEGRKKRKREREKRKRKAGGKERRKKRRKKRKEGNKKGRMGKGGTEAGNQQNFSQSNTHRIPTGWAYRCATGVRVKIFNNRMVPALPNGMET